MLKDTSPWTRNLSGDPSLSIITRRIQQLHKTSHEIRKQWAYLLDCKMGAFVAFWVFSVWWCYCLIVITTCHLSAVCPMSDTSRHRNCFQFYGKAKKTVITTNVPHQFIKISGSWSYHWGCTKHHNCKELTANPPMTCPRICRDSLVHLQWASQTDVRANLLTKTTKSSWLVTTFNTAYPAELCSQLQATFVFSIVQERHHWLAIGRKCVCS